MSYEEPLMPLAPRLRRLYDELKALEAQRDMLLAACELGRPYERQKDVLDFAAVVLETFGYSDAAMVLREKAEAERNAIRLAKEVPQ